MNQSVSQSVARKPKVKKVFKEVMKIDLIPEYEGIDMDKKPMSLSKIVNSEMFFNGETTDENGVLFFYFA